MVDYCLNIVKRHDPDRYLLSLFAPSKHRAALWALFAFNYEIAKTREVVSDTTIGLIRLQWWRDAIAEVYEGKLVRQHEVVTPLAQVIKSYDLPRELFDNLIYAREFDLEGVAPTNIEGLMKYCEYTSVPLFQLALHIIGQNGTNDTGAVDESKGNDTTVVSISKRYALVGLIRSVPYMFSKRRNLLPHDVLHDCDLSEKKIFDFNDMSGLDKVIQTLLVDEDKAQDMLNAKSTSKFLRKVTHMTALYEAQIKSVDYDVFDARLRLPPKFMALRLCVKV